MHETTIRLQQSSEEIISDEVKEIISYRPHWLIRRGNMMFLSVLLIIFSLTWFIKYPDIIKGSARLVALNAPKEINAKVQGKLVKLFVVNEQQVEKEQHLGYLESTGDYDEAMQLQKWINEAINTTKDGNYDVLVSHPLPTLFTLGELQTSYQGFQNELIETKEILASGYYKKKSAALQKDLQYLSQLKANVYQQKKLTEQDKALQQKEYIAYEGLAKDKVIAPLELNQYKSKLIAKEQNLQQIETQLTNSDVASHNKQKEITDLQKQVTDQQQKFHSSLLDLKSGVEAWIQQYVLIASEKGKVLFTSALQENALVTNGQNLFFIQPLQTQYYAEMMTAQKGLGKIKPGQKVMMKVESFPAEEYGSLTGTVNYISSISNRSDSFLIKVNLNNGLKTNYGKNIFFRNNLSAQAEVITDERTLAQRLLGQLKQVWER